MANKYDEDRDDCRNCCLISSWERKWCWVVFLTDTLRGTRWRHILHSRTFQPLQYVSRRLYATGFSSVTGTRLCRTSYCTRRSTTSSYDWTAPRSTTCVTSVDAWRNTMLAWPTNFVMSGEIFCWKWPVTVPTIHDRDRPQHTKPTFSSSGLNTSQCSSSSRNDKPPPPSVCQAMACLAQQHYCASQASAQSVRVGDRRTKDEQKDIATA